MSTLFKPGQPLFNTFNSTGGGYMPMGMLASQGVASMQGVGSMQNVSTSQSTAPMTTSTYPPIISNMTLQQNMHQVMSMSVCPHVHIKRTHV
jgi:hypothetical protein